MAEMSNNGAVSGIKNKEIKVKVVDLAGKEVGEVALDAGIFGVDIKRDIVAEVVRWQLAKRRAGTQSTLRRGDVRGTTKKCKPQKEQGTRHGDKRAPIFRKGGVTFGPKPRSYEYSLNKKIRAMGLKIALSDRFNANSLRVVEDLNVKTFKTADLQKTLDALSLKKALFVSDVINENFSRAVGNLIGFNVLPVCGLNVYSILKHHQLVITKAGLDALSKRFVA